MKIKALFQKILKALGNKRAYWGFQKSEGEIIAQTLMPDIIAFFETEEGKRVFEEWKKEQEKKKKKDEVA